MCVVIALLVGFGGGVWFQARRSRLLAHKQITSAIWEAHEASRRVADAAAEARRQMLHRADQDQGDR